MTSGILTVLFIFPDTLTSLLVAHSDAKLPLSLAGSEERKARADIAAAFQVIVFF